MLKSNLKTKRGQVGETVTWLIATLVIIGIMMLFIYVSYLMAQVKNIGVGNIEIGAEKSLDTISQKTTFAEQITENKNKPTIDNILKNG